MPTDFASPFCSMHREAWIRAISKMVRAAVSTFSATGSRKPNTHRFIDFVKKVTASIFLFLPKKTYLFRAVICGYFPAEQQSAELYETKLPNRDDKPISAEFY